MTIKEIAQLAGVSTSTVSKIMNHKDSSISAETKERVLRIVKEFNYTPYSNALLNNSHSFLLGVLLNSSRSTFLLSGLIDAAREQGYTILVAESCQNLEVERKGISALCRHNVDAVLWEPVSEKSLDYGDSFQAANIPYVLFHSAYGENVYHIDFEQMGYDATLALVQTHHKNISCLLTGDFQDTLFLNGYKRCLFEQGIPFRNDLVFSEIHDALLYKITTHSITSVVSSHFSSALRLYETLNHLRYNVPRDISIVSLRNDAGDHIDFPYISTLTIPYFAFGQHLGKHCIQMLEKGSPIPPFPSTVSLDNTASIQVPYERQSKRLTVIGSINIDNYLKVTKLPVTGTTVMTSNSSLYPGGKGINQSIGATKLGAHVALIGAVGNDLDSDLIFSYLAEHSIESVNIRKCPQEVTGKAYIFVQPDGNSMISILSGANNALCPEDVLYNERVFEDSSYCLMQTEIPCDALIQAGRLAHKYGAKTILKPSACSSLDPELLKYIDIMIPNLNEINILCPGKSLGEQADYFLNLGIGTVIITLGKDGCYLKNPTLEEYFPAADFSAVDNTGAGDAFICALAVYLQKGYSLRNAVQIAVYAAGFSVTREGVTPSLIDKNTLEAYIRQKRPELLKMGRKGNGGEEENGSI
ncbi:MAG: LacI family DNA-binding transcriptional regulator [Lachnospiraceae bacterium]|nr:LacI family DNA-binding transcriptional regulator [Lachnospiraceae bacterium]